MMDLPKPPEEPEVKNIIDKLANFVARNGLAFEKMTKDKQKNNPKFSFLFGGLHYSYYQYKLTTEQQILNKQRSQMSTQAPPPEAIVQQSIQNAPWQQQPPPAGFGGNFQSVPPPQIPQAMPPRAIPPWQQQHPPPAPWQQGPPPRIAGLGGMPPILGPGVPPGPIPQMMPKQEVNDAVKQEADLKEEEADVEKKIKESEDNLAQQREVLNTQEKNEIDTAVRQAQEEYKTSLATAHEVSLEDFNKVLQPIIDSCTKDSIANGKSWILSNSYTKDKCQVIAQQLLSRVAEAAVELKKLKEGDDNKKLFDTQLHIIYLINDVLHHASRKKLSNLSEALESVIVPIFGLTQSYANEQHQQRLSKLLGLWSRFEYFEKSTMDKLAEPEKALADYQNEMEQRYNNVVERIKSSIENQYKQYEKQHQDYAKHIKDQVEKKRNEFEEKKKKAQVIPQPAPAERRGDRDDRRGRDEPEDYHNSPYSGPNNHPNDNRDEQWANDNYDNNDGEEYYDEYGDEIPPRDAGFDRRPPNQGNFGHRRPPPDWRAEPMADEDWDPNNEGGEDWGPGGPEDFPNRNRNWANQRGPPPGPPGPGPRGGVVHDDRRLVPKAPYYDLPAGLMAPLVKLEDMEYKELDPSLIRLPPPIPPSDRLMAAVEMFYGPPSHERPRNPEGWEHNGLFEFFRAKVRANRRAQQDRRGSRSPSRSDRSYSRSRSRSSSSGSRSSRSRSRSRSSSRSPGRGRRATPPSFGPDYYNQSAGNPEGRLDDENRGAQMMKKMGWGGAGLGSAEQGRQDPVRAGDIRDKYDQFKGLGMDMSDPYETFRKNRSYGYGPRARGRENKGD